MHTEQWKMLSKQKRYLYGYESDNLRKYLLQLVTFWNLTGILLEPSILFQLVEKTQEKSIDVNMRPIKIWIRNTLSYRSFDGAQYTDGNGISNKNYNTSLLVWISITSCLHYTYSHVSGAVKFDDGGYHQITLELLFCKPVKYECKSSQPLNSDT
jgi:hypothetical protein